MFYTKRKIRKYFILSCFLFLTILFLGSFSFAQATTYYVDVDSVGGACNDSYTTTQAQVITTPWCSISKANTNLAAGDTVNIRAGRYVSGTGTGSLISLTNTGSEAGGYITYQAYTGEEVILSAGTLKTGFVLTDGKTNTYQATETAASISFAWQNDNYTRYTSTSSIALVEASASTYYLDAANDLLYVHTADGTNPDDHAIEVNRANYVVNITSTKSYVKLKDLKLRNAVAYSVYLQGSNVVVENCEIYDNGITGVFVSGGSNSIINSHSHHSVENGIYFATGTNEVEKSILNNNERTGVYINSTESTFNILNNIFYKNGTQSSYLSMRSGLFVLQGNGINVYNNTFYQNYYGLKVHTSADDIDIKNNVFNEAVADGVYLAGTSNVIFQNNNLYQNSTDVSYIHQADGVAIDTTNMSLDPLFTNAAAYDFTLQKDSPMIDAGATIADVADDYAGNLRTDAGAGNAYDIGAYEYENTISRPIITTNGGNGVGKNFSSTESTISLSGTTSASTETIKVNNSVSGVTYTAGATSWSYSGNLASGSNVFEIAATDGSSNVSGTTTITVIKPVSKKFLAFGDSLTAGVASNNYEAYRVLLDGKLETYYATSTDMVDGGEGGETSASAALRLVNSILETAPEAVFILEGTNDTDDLGTDANEIVARDNLRIMVEYAKSMGVTPILGLVSPIVVGVNSRTQADYDSTDDLNDLLRTMALEEDVVIADHWNTFIQDGWDYDLDTSDESGLLLDGVHTNATGSGIMATNWYNAWVYGKKLHNNRSQVSTNYAMDFDEINTVEIEATSTDVAPVTVYADELGSSYSKVRAQSFSQLTLNFTDLTSSSNYDLFIDSSFSQKYSANANGDLSFSRTNTPSSTTTFELYVSIPPVLSAGSPTGSSFGTSQTLSVATDEAATCRYSTTASTTYALMTSTFSTTGSTLHSQPLTSLGPATHTFYVRCSDSLSNANTNDYIITFTVASQGSGGASGGASPSQTGTVTSYFNSQSFVSAQIEPNTLAGVYSFQIQTKDQNQVSQITNSASLPQALNIVPSLSANYQIVSGGQQITSFSKPISIYIHYQESDVLNFIESTLKIYYFNEQTKQWIPLDSQLNINTNEISAQVNHLTLFVVMGENKGQIVIPAPPFKFTKYLYSDYQGPEVKKLQELLKKLKFYSGKIGGYYGVLTRKAVIKFQRANKISPVGTVGPKTRAALNKKL